MIWESYPWRKKLLSNATWLGNLSQKKPYKNKDLVSFEEKIFLSAFIVRKLFEAKKLKTETEKLKIKVFSAKRLPKTHLRYGNWHHLEKHFDLKHLTRKNLGIATLVNQLIHSFVFIPNLDEKGYIKEFWFCSDQKKENELFLLKICNFKEAIEVVAKSEPSEVRTTYDPRTKVEKIILK